MWSAKNKYVFSARIFGEKIEVLSGLSIDETIGY